MARAASAWLHRVCIRDHGPDDPMMKAVLYTLNACFSEDAAECYWGQERIAKAASMGVTTVRQKLAAASKLEWIAMYPRGISGQRWKSYSYQLCIPDWVPLSEKFEMLADAQASKWGNPSPEATSGGHYPQKGKRRAPAGAAGSQPGANPGQTPDEPGVNTRAPADDASKHRQETYEAPAGDDEKDRQELRGKFSGSSSSSSNPDIRSADADPCIGNQERREEKPENPASRKPLASPKTPAASTEEVWRKNREEILKLYRKDFSRGDIAKMLAQRGVTQQDVVEAISSGMLVV